MQIDIRQLSSLLFNSSKNVEFVHQLNDALREMIRRDNMLVSSGQIAPQLWECKWLNQPDQISGYSKGSAVWMNTDSYEAVLASKQQTIEAYVVNNPTLNTLYNQIDRNDSAARSKFLMAAAKGEASPNVSAIYCLGDLSANTQIRISKIDNNKTYPTDLCCWEDFFIHQSYEDNISIMLNESKKCISSMLQDHIDNYHILGLTSSDMEQAGFFKRYPFNVNDVQTQNFFDHNYCNEMHGFDYVKRWKMLPDGSSWCKVWNSGYVEQGGFVDNIPGQALIPVEFMTTYNYPVGASFYQKGYSTYAGQYKIENPLQANNRYVVTVTPIMYNNIDSPYPEHPMNVAGELVYSSVDVTNMSNAGFFIVNTDLENERYVKYSWHVCGYKTLTKDSQMFDNKNAIETVDISAFGIDPGGILTSFTNNDYSIVSIPDTVVALSGGVFEGCTTVKTFILPKNLMSIAGSRTFAECTNLNSIMIPNQITSIPEQAFYNCANLGHVTMGKDVNFIGTSSFMNDANLMTMSRFDDEDSGHTFDKVGDYAFYNTAIKKANLSLRSAGIDNFWGDYCFADCSNLEEVNILSACYMSNHMFAGCKNLKKVNFKNSHTSYAYPNVFDGCTSLESITIPSKIWYISEEMFKDCTSLKTVDFNDYNISSSMTNLMQKNAFNGCNNMKSLSLPASFNSFDCFDDACLCNCSLTSLSIPGIPVSDVYDFNGFTDVVKKTGFFRLRHNCKLTCKDNQTIDFTFNPSDEIPYVEPLDYNISVDTTTKLNFKTAYQQSSANQFWWYYNASELCAQAYSSRIPCVFIYSLLGCKPCQIYMKNIFNNPDFQNWAKKQKFYLCGMEVDKQPYYNKQLAFCNEKLVPNCLNYAKEDMGQTESMVVPNAMDKKFRRWRVDQNLLNSNLTTPVIIFYYNDGTQVKSYVHSFHNIDTEIANWGVSGVIQCFKSLCLYYFDNNKIEGAKFVVDAVKPFDYREYKPQYDQSHYIITPYKSYPPYDAITTIDELNYDLGKHSIDGYYNGFAYIIGSGFNGVKYMVDTFKGIENCDTIESVNDLVTNGDYGDNAKYRFKVGDSYYKYSMSTTLTSMITIGFGDIQLKAGAAIWTKDESMEPSEDTSKYIVIPTAKGTNNPLMTIDDVNQDICNRCFNGVYYILGCDFENIPYFYNTFQGISQCMTIEEVNNTVSKGNNAKYKFKIGEKYYKYSMSTTDTKLVPNGCMEGLFEAGAPVWTETA